MATNQVSDSQFFRGENLIIPRTFIQSDGTEIAYADISALTVEFIQNGNALFSLVKDTDTTIQRVGATNQLNITLTRANSADLVSGQPLSLKYTIEVTNTDFDQDSDIQKAIVIEEYLIDEVK